MSRILYIPSGIARNLWRMADRAIEEVQGILVGTKTEDGISIAYQLITGAGEEGKINPEQEKLEALLDLKRQDSLLAFVPYHTHARYGVIARGGTARDRYLSEWDQTLMDGIWRYDPLGMHLVVGPWRSRLLSDDHSILKEHRPKQECAAYECLHRRLQAISDSKGISLAKPKLHLGGARGSKS